MSERFCLLGIACSSFRAKLDILTFRGSEGKSFSAGGDLNWMKSMVDYSWDENLEDSRVLFDMIAAIRVCS